MQFVAPDVGSCREAGSIVLLPLAVLTDDNVPITIRVLQVTDGMVGSSAVARVHSLVSASDTDRTANVYVFEVSARVSVTEEIDPGGDCCASAGDEESASAANAGGENS